MAPTPRASYIVQIGKLRHREGVEGAREAFCMGSWWHSLGRGAQQAPVAKGIGLWLVPAPKMSLTKFVIFSRGMRPPFSLELFSQCLNRAPVMSWMLSWRVTGLGHPQQVFGPPTPVLCSWQGVGAHSREADPVTKQEEAWCEEGSRQQESWGSASIRVQVPEGQKPPRTPVRAPPLSAGTLIGKEEGCRCLGSAWRRGWS